MAVRIFVVTHKKISILLPKYYQMIAVGQYTREVSGSDYLRDDTGINISHKNANYCELTAHYWIWKNDRSDIVGLCHYRRFLTKSFFSNKLEYILDDSTVENILTSSADIILPYKILHTRNNVKEEYLNAGKEKDWTALKECLAKFYPEYLSEFIALERRHSCHYQNILICKKELFDKYSEWLFDVLSKVEQSVNLASYDFKNARIFGYMAERLLEVWVNTNKLKVKQFRVLNTEKKRSINKFIKEIIGCLIP